MTTLLTLPSRNKLIWVSMVAIAALLLTLYIVQVNFLTQDVYQIAELEASVHELTETNGELEMTYMHAASLSSFDEMARALNFEKIDSISYITTIDTVVAQKE